MMFLSALITLSSAFANVQPKDINFDYDCKASVDQPRDSRSDIKVMTVNLKNTKISFRFPEQQFSDRKTYRGEVAPSDLDQIGDRNGAGGWIVYNTDTFGFYDESWPFQETRLYVSTDLTTGAKEGSIQIRAYVWDEPVVEYQNFDCIRRN